MKPEFEKAGAELVEWMTGVAKGGGDFLAEQAPMLAQEIVAWHFWSSVFCAVIVVLIGSIVAVTCGVLFRYEVTSKREYWTPEPAAFSVFGVLIGFAIAIGGGGFHGYEAVKAAVAPRLVIIEYAGSVLNGK
jgi:hypothetical protein